ncbi:MAG: hypothetical protein JW751_19920, partial [Polyangiaceae bacterium]|nr:hypothetical protein [Polyangiaceae bacterium]
MPLACELSDPRSVRACVQDILARGERLDALIANAGIMALPQREQARGRVLELPAVDDGKQGEELPTRIPHLEHG